MIEPVGVQPAAAVHQYDNRCRRRARGQIELRMLGPGGPVAHRGHGAGHGEGRDGGKAHGAGHPFHLRRSGGARQA